MRKLRVLSIDGGGLRGVIPLQVIRYIESITGKPIHKIFDVVAGTSTGGLLTCALLVEDTNNRIGGQRLYTLDRIEEIYTVEGKEIFPQLDPLERFRSLYRPRFRKEPLEGILEKYFKTRRITDCLLPIFITSYDIKRDKPIYFTTREANLNYYNNSLLKDICRATSAAPTYFSTYEMNYEQERVHCIDGGIFMNNPSMGVLSEILVNAQSKYYQVDFSGGLQDVHLLSIGTGSSIGTLDTSKSKQWGKYQWAKPAVDLAMRGPVETTNYHLEIFFQLFQCGENYLRLNVLLDDDHIELSDSSDTMIEHWISETKSQITANDSAKILIESFLSKAGFPTI